MNSLQDDFHLLLDYLSIHDPLEPSEVIFVFGGYHLAVPQKAAQLYRQGIAPKILVTGKDGSGVRPCPDWADAIAVVFRNTLCELGVPDDAIMVMADSTNTLEDVLLGVPLLQATLPTLSTLTLVTRPVHQRRALATIRKAYPHYRYICCPADEAIVPVSENSAAGREQLSRALGEIDRLRRYGAKGDIEAQDIPHEVEAAYHRLSAATR